MLKGLDMSVQRFTEIVKAFGHAPPRETASLSAGHTRPYRPPPGPAVLRYCAFCGCDENDAWQLIAGRAGYICGDCVLRACEAIADGGNVVPPNRLQQCLAVWERVGTWLLAQKR
jgi:ClpX C4-type zinc finger